MTKFSEMSRGQFVGVALGALLLLVGAVTVVRAVGSIGGKLAKDAQRSAAASKTGKVNTINNAKFTYLAPGTDPAWKYDPASKAVDQTKGVVRYMVTMVDADV